MGICLGRIDTPTLLLQGWRRETQFNQVWRGQEADGSFHSQQPQMGYYNMPTLEDVSNRCANIMFHTGFLMFEH